MEKKEIEEKIDNAIPTGSICDLGTVLKVVIRSAMKDFLAKIIAEVQDEIVRSSVEAVKETCVRHKAYSIDDAASELRVSGGIIRRLIKEGKIEARLIGGRQIIPEREIDKILA